MKELKMTRFSFFILAAIVFFLVLSGCSNSNPNPNENFEELLTNIYTDGNFVFADVPWYTTKEEVMEQKNLDESNLITPHNDSLKDSLGVFEMENGSLNLEAYYVFIDDQIDSEFITGRYLFETEDKNLFDEFAYKLKEVLAEALEDPREGNLEVLEDGEVSNSGRTQIVWDGKDGSQLKVFSTSINGMDNYVIMITTHAPRPEGFLDKIKSDN